ncbi:MAG TPA: hypothetical protein VFN65_11995 [Solirubrobacteraceae bacterium]|nr:hypothetical protein [Solirubrobacteraceae bacterium]
MIDATRDLGAPPGCAGRSGRAAAAPERWSLPLAITLIAGVCLLLGIVGADARWLAALGREIGPAGRIPAGLPFAAAPTRHWHNVTVLAELGFWRLESTLGDRGLLLAQALAVAIAFTSLARDARRAGAADEQTASACLIAALGAVASLVIARSQLFSIALFPVLLALLRSDARRGSRRIWMVVPLLALWSNLHGGVLVGLAVALVYLLGDRLRRSPVETVLLVVLCTSALCVNPAGVHALAYYHAVLSGAAAQHGQGMWGPLSPTSPSGALTIVAGLMLLWRVRRNRPRAWELVVTVLLAVMTIHAARSGIWLLFWLVAPAALGGRPGPPWRRRTVVLAAASLAVLTLAAVRGPARGGADRQVLAQVIHLAGRSPILADDIPAEQIALAGGRVWVSDPIDAFSPRMQLAYLEWMAGDRAGLAAVGPAVRVVLAGAGSPEAALMRRDRSFRAITRTGGFELFERVVGGRDEPARARVTLAARTARRT